eukprot:CAMPEP_0114308064 /NCGR_PEP_ID=MMETSP0059-20121206/17846_1 /TAXON_ID=36894 /ORGANISM="Pyramimonas parkeae, Strain CCMP726" /LENGTH=448 /DNA_ID=CAMNT_0001431655 /DNA_START=560 /DNA_END=1907 /DNA_ORIENTATION=-
MSAPDAYQRPPIPLRRGPSMDDMLSEWSSFDVNIGSAYGAGFGQPYNGPVLSTHPEIPEKVLRTNGDVLAYSNPLQENSRLGDARGSIPATTCRMYEANPTGSGPTGGPAGGLPSTTLSNTGTYDFPPTCLQSMGAPVVASEASWKLSDIKPSLVHTLRRGSLDSRDPGKGKSPMVEPPLKAASEGEECDDEVSGGEVEDGGGGGKKKDKKSRRMLSNRESARRSRQRKQQHLDELQGQVSRLRNENLGILHRLAMVAQMTDNILDENQRLRGEAAALSARLGFPLPSAASGLTSQLPLMGNVPPQMQHQMHPHTLHSQHLHPQHTHMHPQQQSQISRHHSHMSAHQQSQIHHPQQSNLHLQQQAQIPQQLSQMHSQQQPQMHQQHQSQMHSQQNEMRSQHHHQIVQQPSPLSLEPPPDQLQGLPFSQQVGLPMGMAVMQPGDILPLS